MTKTVLSLANGDAPPADMSKAMTSAGVRIIKSFLDSEAHREYSINIPNNGCISNISHDTVVEIPAVVDTTGVHGVSVGPLPKGIAAMCNQQGAIQELSVEAAVEGSYYKALQAYVARSASLYTHSSKRNTGRPSQKSRLDTAKVH